MIVLFKNDADYFDYMIDDTGCLCQKEICNKFLRFVCNIHRSVKLNRIIEIPFKSIWYKWYLNYDELPSIGKAYFVFFEGNQLAYDKGYIEYLRRRYPNAKFVFRYTNMKYELNDWTFDFVERVYDLIITMDTCNESCDKWKHYFNTYNLSKLAKTSNYEIEYDVFFVGRDKGRHDDLVRLYRYLTDKNVKCLFLLYGVEKRKQSKDYEGIKYIDYMKYEDIVEYIHKSKCILEVVQNSQKGSSLRPIEAIAYDKKLLTNDCNIVNCEYYNRKNMFVFSEPEDIDVEFLKADAIFGDGYREIISSKKLFDMIESYFRVKEGDN